MEQGPDRITVALYRAVPVLMVLGFVSFVAGLIGHISAGYIVGIASFIAASLATRRVQRYGSGPGDFRIVQRSKAWTAETFELGYRDNSFGRNMVASATAQAAAHGYRLAGEPVRRKGLIFPWVYATFEKEPSGKAARDPSGYSPLEAAE